MLSHCRGKRSHSGGASTGCWAPNWEARALSAWGGRRRGLCHSLGSWVRQVPNTLPGGLMGSLLEGEGGGEAADTKGEHGQFWKAPLPGGWEQTRVSGL